MMGEARQNGSIARLPLLILFALFVLALLCALVAGMNAYRFVLGVQEESSEQRFAVGLLENSIKAADSYSAVKIGRGPEGDSLVLVEYGDDDVFETRIYQFDGSVYQESSLAENPYNPDTATKVLDTHLFSIEFDSNLIEIETDEGTAVVALRSMTDGVRSDV